MKKMLSLHQQRVLACRAHEEGMNALRLVLRRLRWDDHGGYVGSAELVYRPNRPLPCGATVWLEADATLPVP